VQAPAAKGQQGGVNLSAVELEFGVAIAARAGGITEAVQLSQGRLEGFGRVFKGAGRFGAQVEIQIEGRQRLFLMVELNVD